MSTYELGRMSYVKDIFGSSTDSDASFEGFSVAEMTETKNASSGDRVFPSGGGTGGPPMSSMSPHKIEKLSPPSIFVDHDKIFFRYFFNLCMTKANLTSITSLRMQLYSLIEILKQQQLKSLKQDQ